MDEHFHYDHRLGIFLPNLLVEWEEYNEVTQQQILLFWEQNRGRIPDRIAELETAINQKQAELFDESDFPRSCQLNSEIADLASIINDLWIWYRANQTLSSKVHH